ncbi:MAG: type I methionyl aminopeptidase, partial [Desulfobacteraceae bacterium]
MLKELNKPSRNAPCPCGSGLKYKKCCLGRDPVLNEQLKDLYFRKFNIRLKGPQDIEGIRAAGRLAVAALDLAGQHIKPGVKTDDLNTLVHDFTIQNQAVPAPLNYRGFPKSVCISVNEVICHGIPGERILKNGDIVNVDVTTILNGYYGDVSKTFFVGTPGPDARKIVRVARHSLKKGIEMVKPGNQLGDILVLRVGQQADIEAVVGRGDAQHVFAAGLDGELQPGQ